MGDTSCSAEERVQEYLGENQGCHYVNKEVFWHSYAKIKPFLDNLLLFPLLMSHDLATDTEDVEKLINSSLQPHHRHLALLELADRGGEYGYMLLFMCIAATSEKSPGHADAARILQETGIASLLLCTTRDQCRAI